MNSSRSLLAKGTRANLQANYIQTLHQLLEGTIAPDTNIIKAVRP